MYQFDKQELRQFFLAKRRALSRKQWQEASHKLCDRLSDFFLFQQAKTILTYSCFRQEPDLIHLRDEYNNKRRWGLPRCVDRALVWHSWELQDTLNKGAFGISEPSADAPTIDPFAVDLILVPSVAIDKRGYRLGYGGGFYDRMLANPEWQNIPTIGIIFDFAYVEELPIEPWDRPLEWVCTETRTQMFVVEL
jgi:5-formyltetrahydrofolate cyclo-ligase